jgi:hypothetical protein
LSRLWEPDKNRVAFIGLNPSTADHRIDDPTIRRCIGFAKEWGFGGMIIVNLFAYRTPYPAELKAAQDPMGPRNNFYLNNVLKETTLQVAIWGNDGEFLAQDEKACKRFKTLYAIKINKSGKPAHPLYLRKGLKPILWQADHPV